MFEVRFAFLILTREEYMMFKKSGITHGYDFNRYYDDIDCAFEVARNFADDGFDQYIRGDEFILVYIADVFNDEGDLAYE